jgi:hypothetical protein
MRTARTLGLVAWLAASVCGQATQPTRELDAAFAELRRALDQRPGEVRGSSPRPRRLLEVFVQRFESEPDARVLQARCWLGTLLLHALEPLAAKKQFEIVSERATAKDADLRARSLYGLAQSCELLGEEVATRGHLERVQREFRGTRYADWAAVARQRLDPGRVALRAGAHAPAVAPMLDLNAKSRDLRRLQGGPVMVVFWSVEHEASLATLKQWLQLWRRAGFTDDRFLVYALGAGADRLRERVRQAALDVPVIPCGDQFLEPVVMQFGVRALPAGFLLGADGVVLARDPSPAAYAALLAELAR